MRKKVLLPLASLSLAMPLLVSCGNSDKIPLRGQTATGEVANATALLNEGRAYQSSGKNSKALSTYKEVSKSYPNSTAAPEALYARANMLDQQGELIKAFDAYQELIVNYQASSRYASALRRQEHVAHAAANGVIKNSFLGMKTKIAPSRVETMLGQVRDNAPQASSAPKAQFAIGQVWQQSGNAEKAIAAFRRISADYPESSQAPEALYQIGETLILKTKKGNKNKANFDNATSIYNELIQRYPNHKRAADARKRIKGLGGQEIQRSYNIAEFYRKKGEKTSAIFYYKEVLRKSKSGPLRDQASQRIAELEAQP
ncbi:tetratricopeptide repeat protein [Verrucomicrobiaceae bacterium N1E253]|uniref:Tetratricopeptide repeat protein n=1 Tax=Oceaniferula marina TaxID=2748318 RepID=A0A851GI25_9BACT|nr:tetratricopeptide repeat protein [Oceaniferula marina]NWK56849.1 tetratricopeptide repeat protein [Oceaniferula marina]